MLNMLVESLQFPLDVVIISGILCHKFRRIPSLMALTLSNDINSQWFRDVFS